MIFEKRIRVRDTLLILVVAATGWLTPLVSRIWIDVTAGDEVRYEDVIRYLSGWGDWGFIVGAGNALSFASLAIVVGKLSLYARKISFVGHVFGVLGIVLVIPYLGFSGYYDIHRAITYGEPGSSTAVIGFVTGPIVLFMWGIGIYGALLGTGWLLACLRRSKRVWLSERRGGSLSQ